jgi:hypothetical protein
MDILWDGREMLSLIEKCPDYRGLFNANVQFLGLGVMSLMEGCPPGRSVR